MGLQITSCSRWYLLLTVLQIPRHLTFTDVIAFVSLVVLILKLNADQGQSRMIQLMRSVLQDGTLYFFMTAFHIAEVTPFLPPVDEGLILTS